MIQIVENRFSKRYTEKQFKEYKARMEALNQLKDAIEMLRELGEKLRLVQEMHLKPEKDPRSHLRVVK